MAGRTQQYLRTEYIQPPPGPPTDAKNSPLALLAQTCSAIGKEIPQGGKLVMQSKMVSNHPSDSKQTTGNVTLHKPPMAPRSPTANRASPMRSPVSPIPSTGGNGIGALKREKSPLAPRLTPPAKKMRSSPDLSKPSPSDNLRAAGRDPKEEAKSLQRSDQKRDSFADAKRRHGSAANENTSKQSGGKEAVKLHKASPASSPTSSKSYGCSSTCGCPLTTSVNEAVRAGTSSSVSPHQHNPMLSLYDPFCAGCQGPHVAGSACYEGLKSSQFPFYPFTSPASTYYAQMVMAAAARSGGGGGLDPVPHICNWVNVGSGSCGKRFATAEELSNHLRSHAVPSASNTPSGVGNFLLNGLDKLSTNPYAAYLTQQAAALAAVSPTTANPSASSFLSRSNSPLGRYHPYKATSMFSQLSGVPPIPIAAAGSGPYCSPFTLYSQRLGAAASGFSYP